MDAFTKILDSFFFKEYGKMYTFYEKCRIHQVRMSMTLYAYLHVLSTVGNTIYCRGKNCTDLLLQVVDASRVHAVIYMPLGCANLPKLCIPDAFRDER